MTALVLHPGALGDVLLAVPALRALRAEGDLVTIAAQPRIGALLVALGVVDQAIAFDTLGIEALFTDTSLPRDAPLARHLSTATRVVCWFGARDAQFTRRLSSLAPRAAIAPPSTPPTLVWRHLLSTAAATMPTAHDQDSPTDTLVAPIAVTRSVAAAGREALVAAGWDGHSHLLIVHPGAGGTSKRWPAEGFAEITASLEATVAVHEGPADAEAVSAFMASADRVFAKKSSSAPILLMNPALPTLAGALSLATAYLGNDSGVSHLAAAVGTRSVVLFTEPALPWLPWSKTADGVTVTTSHLHPNERAAIAAALAGVFAAQPR